MTTSLSRRSLLMTAGALAAFAATGAMAQTAPTQPPAPTPGQWAKSPDLYHVCLSPDGSRIGFIHEQAGDKYLRVITVADGKVKNFNIGKADIADLAFLDESHLVVTSLGFDRSGNNHYRHRIGSIYDIDHSSVTALFSNIPDFGGELSTPVSLVTRNGKRQIIVGAFKVSPESFHYLYRFDADGKGTVMDQGPENTFDWITDGEGNALARHSYVERTRQWLLEYHQGGAWKTIASGKYDYDLPSLVGLARDGKSILVSKYDDAGEAHYYEVSPDGAFSQPLSFSADQATLLFDPVTLRMNGHTIDGDWVQYAYDDPALMAIVEKAQKAVPGYRMKIAARADNPNRVIIYSEGDDDSGTYYFIDFAKGQSMAIGASYPDIAPEWTAHKAAIHYKAADGLDIEGFLTLPPNKEAKALPVVVIAHGGPEVRADLGVESSLSVSGQAYAAGYLVHALATAGYAVLQPNFRGSAGYGGAFRKAGFGEYGRKMLNDMADGVKFLASQGIVDGRRAAIVGAIGGGYAALASMALLPGTYACAVDIEGTSDLRNFIERKRGFNTADTTYAYRYWQRWLGDLAQLDALSPVKNAAKVQAPILILHGTDDQSVPTAQSKDMVAALKAAGKDVTFVQQDWNLSESQRIAAAELVTNYVKAHLPV